MTESSMPPPDAAKPTADASPPASETSAVEAKPLRVLTRAELDLQMERVSDLIGLLLHDLRSLSGSNPYEQVRVSLAITAGKDLFSALLGITDV